MDKVIEYCGSLQLKVVLDRHSCKAANYDNEDVWFIADDPFCTEDRWVTDWLTLAERYKGDQTVIGADLFNEPKRSATWGDSNPLTDWNKAAERCAEAVHVVNSDWLIIVEGVQYYTVPNGENTQKGWGSNLKGVMHYPVSLSFPNKLVYSAHEYPETANTKKWYFYDPTYPENLDEIWTEYWGYLVRNNTAPVLIGEFGSALNTTRDEAWFNKLNDYMNGYYNFDESIQLPAGGKGVSFAYWAYNPSGAGGTVGGILEEDWLTVNTRTMDYLQGFLAPGSLQQMVPTSSPITTPTAAPTVWDCPRGPYSNSCEGKIKYHMDTNNHPSEWYVNNNVDPTSRCSVLIWLSAPSRQHCITPPEPPTAEPSVASTGDSTAMPTAVLTAVPTEVPSAMPTANPSADPTAGPTATPSTNPTVTPSIDLSVNPSADPTSDATAVPTAADLLDCSSVDDWSGYVKFFTGDQAVYEGILYEALKNGKNKDPVTWSTKAKAQQNKWNSIGQCSSRAPTTDPTLRECDINGVRWDKTAVFKIGEQVFYEGYLYEAVKKGKNKNPVTWSTKSNSAFNKWINLGECFSFAPTTAPTWTSDNTDCAGPFPDHSKCEQKIETFLTKKDSAFFAFRGMDGSRCSIQQWFSNPARGSECPPVVEEDCVGPFPDHDKCETKIQLFQKNKDSKWFAFRNMDGSRCSIQEFLSTAPQTDCPSR